MRTENANQTNGKRFGRGEGGFPARQPFARRLFKVAAASRRRPCPERPAPGLLMALPPRRSPPRFQDGGSSPARYACASGHRCRTMWRHCNTSLRHPSFPAMRLSRSVPSTVSFSKSPDRCKVARPRRGRLPMARPDWVIALHSGFLRDLRVLLFKSFCYLEQKHAKHPQFFQPHSRFAFQIFPIESGQAGIRAATLQSGCGGNIACPWLESLVLRG